MKILSANGANIPALGFGTWDLRGETCAEMVCQALETGYTHIDTAIMYDNEVQVGEGLRNSGRPRDSYFLTTKVWPTEFSEGVYQKAVENSLMRLGVDQVDLLLIHWPPHIGDVQQWAKMINDVADRGWTKHLGVSNFTTNQIDAIVEASDRPIVCNQVENHPFLNQTRIREACAKHNMALIAYCPLFRGGELFAHETIQQICSETGRTPAQVVLRWHMEFDGGGAIPKTATASRLSENLDIFDFTLSDEQMTRINALMVRQERLCDFEFSPNWDPV